MPLTLVSQILVDDDAVIDVDTAALERVRHWLDSDADDDEVAVESQSALRDDALHPVRSFEGSDCVLEDRANAMRAMKVGERLPDRLAKHAEERRF